MRSSISIHDIRRTVSIAGVMLLSIALVPQMTLAVGSQGGATGQGIGPQGAVPGGTQVVRKHFVAGADGRCLRVVAAGVRTRNARWLRCPWASRRLRAGRSRS
jgi:hypothetical protein